MSIKFSLQSLKRNEDDLRKKIVIPMIWALGCKYVKDNQGMNEEGKDTIYLTYHPLLRKEVYGAIILKSVNVGKTELAKIVQEIKEAISPFPDPRDPNDQIRTRELMLMTPFDFTKDVKDSIFKQCSNAIPNMHFVNGDEMERLIAGIMSEHYEKTKILRTFSIDSFLTICEEITNRKITISSSTIGLTHGETELVE